MNYILSPYSPRAKVSGAKEAFGAEGCDHGAQAPTELKPEPPETEAHGAKASEPPLLDHLVLRLLMPEHEPQAPELKPEHTKPKPPEAKASVSPGAKASGAKATTSAGTCQIPGPALDQSWAALGRSWLFLATPGPLWAALGPL